MRFLALLALTLCLGAFAHEEHHKGHKHSHNLRAVRHIHTSFDDFAKEHLDWLSEDEKAEVKKLHEENKEKAREKVLEILEASTGEKKTKGAAALQAACRELIVNILGEDVAKDLKQMKESGSTTEEISTKVTELLKGVTDEAKKAKALEYKFVCAKVYELKASKKRRNVAHHDLESKLKSEWAWLTDEQKEEVRKFKNDGKGDEFLLTKVFEYFKTADDKSKAEDGLQTTCGGAVLTILGPEKAEELKTFMANGATPDAYESKVKELLNSAPKKTLTKNQESCKTVFTSASRRRRHIHTTFEDFSKEHLNWLSDEEKAEVGKLHADNKETARSKVLEILEASTGDKRKNGIAQLQAACRELLVAVLGEDAAKDLKQMKESGSSNEEIQTKIAELLKGVTDEKLKEKAAEHKQTCEKVYSLKAEAKRRRRHEGHHHTLEDYLESSHLAWLTDLEKESLRKLAQEGKSKEVIQQQVLEYYAATSGEVREKATAGLQSGCRELFAHLIGAEKTAEIKTLKESGASKQDLAKKGEQFIEEIEDPKKKEEAKFYAIGCRKAFDVESKRKRHIHHRQKRHDHEAHSLDELFKTYLSWLTEDQQKKLTELKNEGKSRDELQKEVLQYYDAASDSVKETARQKMQDGCRKLLVKVLGEDKATELKTLRESGTPIKEIAAKTTEWINELTDENVKKSAQEYSVVCNKAFNLE